MLIIPPSQFRKGVIRPKRKAAVVPSTLTLVAATYLHNEGPSLRLQFDRAIDIGGINVDAILVDDGFYNVKLYRGMSETATLIDPRTVQMELAEQEDATVSDVQLTASGATGIVASDDGGTWAGVEDLVLPFPTPVILSVTHGDDADRLVVSLNVPMTGFGDIDKMLGASMDGEEWVYPTTLNNEDASNIVFMFSEDVSAMTQWRVPGPSNWVFASGFLGDPTTGTIE